MNYLLCNTEYLIMSVPEMVSAHLCIYLATSLFMWLANCTLWISDKL